MSYMKKRSHLFTLIICIFGYSVVVGADKTNSPTIRPADDNEEIPRSFEAAINHAIGNRVELNIEAAELNKEKAKVKEAEGAFYPSVDLSWDINRIKQSDKYAGIDVLATFRGEKIPVSIERLSPEYIISGTLGSTYTVYEGGKIQASYAKAVAQETIARLNSEIARQKIIKETAKSYLQFKKAQLDFSLARSVEELANKKSILANNQWDHRQISELEKNYAILDYINTQKKSIAARGELKITFSKYLDALGYNSQAKNLVDPSIITMDSITIEQLTNYISSIVEVSKPGIQLAQAHIEIASTDRKIYRSEFRPKINLFFEYNLVGRGENSINDAFSEFKRSDAVGGISLDWNLYNGGRSDSRMTQASEENISVQNSFKKVNDEYEMNMSASVDKIEQLREQLSLEKQIAALKKTQEKVAQEQLTAGQISVIDFEQIKHDRLEADKQIELTEIELSLNFIEQILVTNF